jgi:hypothetical protein
VTVVNQSKKPSRIIAENKRSSFFSIALSSQSSFYTMNADELLTCLEC